ncbi:chloroplast envelope membrane protein-like [Glycine soja]|uniref:Chloroplast envelope membrane protein n=1 Tax=Glycine soja TaxID=3848 RepID=A0A0B2QY85_GLYSO|nr:chloroplast envelope membrane protein-like [Glycine soja]XP_028246479.1 chloroplast envelope membrane protein-like [Glycine soja]KHN24979.1 Chloroplast envelope membrane protein [Glycine soja]RZC00426.1 Chloroplast envelope membrane protein isoform A [Glycine soja]RZC00427.1 Chloroplast envelope membrane protein isoform B [Glycine soja]
MILMSSSIVLCDKNLILFNQKLLLKSFVSHGSSSNFVIQFGSKTRRLNGFISKAEKHSRKSSWWQNFFFKDDGNWLGLRDDDMAEAEAEAEAEGEGERTQELSEGDKFEAWKRRAEAIVELREAQEDRRNQDYRKWEDWLLDGDGDGNGEDNTSSWEQGMKDYRENVRADSGDVPVEKGFVESARYLIFGREDDDMLYEDRVFQYASSNSAKFLAVLIIVPWAMDFLVHDYILMPFLDRYVKTVPLAAQMLDVRRYQKLQIIEELRTERGRFELEVEIGKSPPLSDDEVWWELRHRALDLREEWRLENRRAFANIWSDTVYGISLFILLYFNKSKVALLKFTGYKIINNISDTGKAFLIILITDIFLGYHSESGWQTLLEIIVEHYGLEVDQSAITIFICLVPVVIDACVKLWLFKFLPRLSPSVTNIFQEMKRH